MPCAIAHGKRDVRLALSAAAGKQLLCNLLAQMQPKRALSLQTLSAQSQSEYLVQRVQAAATVHTAQFHTLFLCIYSVSVLVSRDQHCLKNCSIDVITWVLLQAGSYSFEHQCNYCLDFLSFFQFILFLCLLSLSFCPWSVFTLLFSVFCVTDSHSDRRDQPLVLSNSQTVPGHKK